MGLRIIITSRQIKWAKGYILISSRLSYKNYLELYVVAVVVCQKSILWSHLYSPIHCSKKLERLLCSSYIALLGMRLFCCASQGKPFQQWTQGWVRWLLRWLKQAERMLTRLSKQPAKPSRKALGPGCQAVYAPHFTVKFLAFWFCFGFWKFSFFHRNTSTPWRKLKRGTEFNTWVGIAIEFHLKLVQVMFV